jgi:hypothetical protein
MAPGLFRNERLWQKKQSVTIFRLDEQSRLMHSGRPCTDITLIRLHIGQSVLLMLNMRQSGLKQYDFSSEKEYSLQNPQNEKALPPGQVLFVQSALPGLLTSRVEPQAKQLPDAMIFKPLGS